MALCGASKQHLAALSHRTTRLLREGPRYPTHPHSSYSAGHTPVAQWTTVALRRVDSDSPPSGSAGQSLAGRLGDVSVAELLAYCRNRSFTGTLFIKPPDAERHKLHFERGLLSHAAGPWQSLELYQAVLGQMLPPEHIELASNFAEHAKVSLVDAADRLSLLPPSSIAASREALVGAGLQQLCQASEESRFAFVHRAQPPNDGIAVEPPLDTLNLIVACTLTERRPKAWREVSRFANTKLRIEAQNRAVLLGILEGPARAIVNQLVHTPQSAQALAELGLVSRDQIVASVYTLWLTHHIVSSVGGWPGLEAAGISSANASGTHRVDLSGSGTAPPPVARSGPPSSIPSPATIYERERAMEKKVLDAWLTAQTNPERAERASTFARKAISVFPRNPRIRLYAARLYQQTNRAHAAIEEFEHVLRLDAKNEDARTELDQLRRTLLPPPKGPTTKGRG